MSSKPSDAVPQFVVTSDGDLYGHESPENRELVRRIHACFVACEGISTEELESGIIGEMRRVIAQVLPMLKNRGGQSEAA